MLRAGKLDLRPLVMLGMILALVGGCRYVRHVENDDPSVFVYTVASATETLTSISSRYQITVDDIISANRLRTVKLAVGQKLRLPGARENVAPPVVAKPVEPDTKQLFDVPRSKWAIEGIDTNNIDPMGVKPWRITIHHSGDNIDLGADPTDALLRIERQHKLGAGKNEPFACIGYHFVISADGRIWEGRPLKYQGAHSTGDNNKGNIGICLLGNFEVQYVTKQQQAHLVELVGRLCDQYGISRSNIVGHSHFKDTDCPGKHLLPLVQSLAK